MEKNPDYNSRMSAIKMLMSGAQIPELNEEDSQLEQTPTSQKKLGQLSKQLLDELSDERKTENSFKNEQAGIINIELNNSPIRKFDNSEAVLVKNPSTSKKGEIRINDEGNLSMDDQHSSFIISTPKNFSNN